LLNSIKGEKDNFVIGIIDENTKLLKSFLTYKIENERLIIGLLGTLGEYSRSGLAKILINDIEHIAISNKCKKILVSTQGHNTIANDFYTKLDFKISKVEHWYLNGG
jgi:ribosomal protein S18 acetylase RimI-like enzyme